MIAGPAATERREPRLGTSKRYAHVVDARMDARILQRIAKEHRPGSLKTVELQLDVDPLTRPPAPLPVLAWVRYGDHPVQVEAELIQWTERVCAIRWEVVDVGEQKAWVWASAVQPRRRR